MNATTQPRNVPVCKAAKAAKTGRVNFVDVRIPRVRPAYCGIWYRGAHYGSDAQARAESAEMAQPASSYDFGF